MDNSGQDVQPQQKVKTEEGVPAVQSGDPCNTQYNSDDYKTELDSASEIDPKDYETELDSASDYETELDSASELASPKDYETDIVAEDVTENTAVNHVVAEDVTENTAVNHVVAEDVTILGPTKKRKCEESSTQTSKKANTSTQNKNVDDPFIAGLVLFNSTIWTAVENMMGFLDQRITNLHVNGNNLNRDVQKTLDNHLSVCEGIEMLELLGNMEDIKLTLVKQALIFLQQFVKFSTNYLNDTLELETLIPAVVNISLMINMLISNRLSYEETGVDMLVGWKAVDAGLRGLVIQDKLSAVARTANRFSKQLKEANTLAEIAVYNNVFVSRMITLFKTRQAGKDAPVVPSHIVEIHNKHGIIMSKNDTTYRKLMYGGRK